MQTSCLHLSFIKSKIRQLHTHHLIFELHTFIECSNRSAKHSDKYQSLAVAEQYVLYHDLEHSILEDLHHIILKTERNSAHNIGLNHTTQKTKVTMTRFFIIHQSYNAFSQHVNVRKQYSKLVIWTLWTCISGFKYIGMTLTSAETTLIETLL